MPAARAALRPEYRLFYDSLVDYGDWVLIEPYGFMFRPRVDFATFRPYADGFWAPSDPWGWVWISAEPFGWATYHYGRWGYSRRIGWFWALGIATLTAFIVQGATGLALATVYIPSPADAYESIRFIDAEKTLGWLVRGMHFYGASAVIVLIVAHMLRVLLTGSYKYPRELSWLTGVGLLIITLGLAFTGQLLRWDQDSIGSVFVASDFAGRVPVIVTRKKYVRKPKKGPPGLALCTNEKTVMVRPREPEAADTSVDRLGGM